MKCDILKLKVQIQKTEKNIYVKKTTQKVINRIINGNKKLIYKKNQRQKLNLKNKMIKTPC